MNCFLRAFVPGRKFVSDATGNVAIVFALASIPIMSVISVSIDYGRAASLRSNMQAAADAASLMIAKDAADLTASQIQDRATKFFLANLKSKDAAAVKVTAVYVPNTGNGASVTISATSTIKNQFAKFLNAESTPLSTTSKATWGNARMRIALSLDVTGSMKDDGKISALRDAVTKFINDMSAQSKNTGDVLISIVPFAKDVNVGPSNDNANWVTFSDWDEESGQCAGTTWIGTEYPIPSYKTKTSCKNASSSYKWKAYKKKDWQGCVSDRNQPHDITSTSASSDDSDYRAEYYDACGPEMMPLSSNWSALKSKVASLAPDGNTNQPIGITMAWQTLLTTSPWPAPAKQSDASYIDAIIHLSDGENTENRWSNSKTQIDARQATLCNNIKAQKITLYMIQVNTDSQPTQSVMKNCASNPDNFYMLTSGSQTVATFSDIGKKLSQLKISY